MKSAIFRGLLCSMIIGGLAGEGIAQSVYSLTSLGQVRPTAINNHGEISAYEGDSPHSGYHLQVDGNQVTTTDLGPGIPGDINDAGKIVGNTFTGFTWTADGGKQVFGDGVRVTGINEAGKITGYHIGNDNNAFLWDSSTGFQTLDSANYSQGWAVNNLDQVVGTRSVAGGADVGVLYEPGQDPVDLQPKSDPDYSFSARDINNNSQVVVNGSTVDAGRKAYVWDAAGGFTSIPKLDAMDYTVGLGINDSGVVAGWGAVAFEDSDIHAIIWHESYGTQDLNDLVDGSAAGWVLGSASDINEHGYIVGTGWDPGGVPTGFLLRPVPEPSGFAACLFALGAFCLVRLRNRTSS